MKTLFFLTLFVTGTFISHGQIDFNQLDGSINANESLKEYGADKRFKFMVEPVDDYILIKIKSEPLEVASICINYENEVVVLHASAALGKVIYRKGATNLWRLEGKFDWGMRDKGMDQKTIDERKNYLNQQQWVATTMSMGEPGEVEFIIDKSLLNGNQSFNVAAGLMPSATPDKIISIPKGFEPGCANAQLVSGDPEANYDFLPRGWYKIDLE